MAPLGYPARSFAFPGPKFVFEKFQVCLIIFISFLGIPLSKLESKLVEIRSYHINWESYYQGGVISADDHTFISRFDKKSLQQKAESMNSDPEQVR